MHEKSPKLSPIAMETIRRFISWANQFDAEVNENISADNPISDDFALSDTIAPDGLSVGDLRRLRDILRATLQS